MAWIVRLSLVPDWGRRAIRLSLALVFFTSLGLTLWPVPEYLRAEWGDEVVQSCNWAGATCAVVAASPLIGKVTQLSYERTLGTLTGGLLGFLVFDYGVLLLPPVAAEVLMVAAAAAVGAVSCWLSARFKLDASMRLFVITFLIVTFGAHSKDDKSAMGVALLRTGGILAGVVVFMTLTVILLPKSATLESLREMKNGLKLLTELNTLVWTSKEEASAALKQATEDARAAEAAAASAVAAAAADGAAAADTHAPGQQQQQQQGAGSSMPFVSRWLSSFRSGSSSSSSRRADGYAPLPAADAADAAEAGLGSSFAPHAAAAAPSNGSAIPASAGPPARQQASSLTQALKRTEAPAAAGSSNSSNFSSGQQSRSLSPAAAAAGQQQQQQRAKTYQEVRDHYEVRCEAVLTSVYQSMFKVKEHIALANSEVYIYHFWGHYFFLPSMFGSKGLINCLLPNRWRLPVEAMDDLSTSVRVIARLLWTVHLDYSQGFDEVLQALPPSANMTNLLTELGGVIAATLGVLVEAFPNKTTILVTHLQQLDELVDRILEIAEAQHEALISELAATRAAQTLRRSGDSRVASSGLPHPGAATASGSLRRLSLTLQPQQQQQQQQQQGAPGPQRLFARTASVIERPVAAPSSLQAGSRFQSMAVRLPAAAGSTPPAAWGIPVSQQRPAAAEPDTLVGTAPPFEVAGWQQQQHMQQQPDVQQPLLLGTTPTRSITYVTFAGRQQQQQQQQQPPDVLDSLEFQGVGKPLPAESPDFPSPLRPAAAGVASTADRQDSAAASTGADPQGDLMFPMEDSAAAAPAQQQQPQQPQAAQLQPAGSSKGAAVAPAANLFRFRPKPFAVLAAVKLQRAGHEDCGACTDRLASAAAAEDAAVAATAAHMRRCLSSESAPDAAAAKDAAALLQQQQPQLVQPSEPSFAGAAAAAVAAADGEEKQESVNTKGYVRMMRWYSFQFLIMELEDELGRLYDGVTRTLGALPYGL